MTQSQSVVAHFCKIRVNKPPPSKHLCSLDDARHVIADLTRRATDTGCRAVSLFNLFSAIGPQTAIDRFREHSSAILTADTANPARTIALSVDLEIEDDEFLFWVLQVVSNGITSERLAQHPSLETQLLALASLPTSDIVQATFLPPKRVLSPAGQEKERSPVVSFAEWYGLASTHRHPTDVICYLDGDGMNRANPASNSKKASLFARHAAAVAAHREETDPTELIRAIYRSRMQTDGLFDDLVRRLNTNFQTSGASSGYLGGDELIAAGQLNDIKRVVEECCAQSELEISFTAGSIPFRATDSSEDIALPLETSLASAKNLLRGKSYFNIL